MQQSIGRSAVDCILAILLFVIWPFGGALYAFYNMARNRNFTFFAVILSLFMGLYGYTLNPSPSGWETDMSRTYNIADMLADLDLAEALPALISNGDLSIFYFWVVKHAGFCTQFIGFFSAFLLYGSFIFVVHKVLTRYGCNVHRDTFVLGILMCFLTTHPIFFSGIRTSMAMGLSLFGLGYYLSGKNKTATLFMLASMCIHFFFIVIVLLFFLLRWASTKNIKRVCWILLIGTIFYYPIMKLAINFFMNMGGIGMILASKIEGYGLNWEAEDGIVLIGSRKWLIQSVSLAIAFLYFRLRVSVKDAIYRKIDLFTLLIISFAIFSIYNLVIVSRIVYIINVLCILSLITIKLHAGNSSIIRKINVLSYFICFLGVFIFLNECLVISGYTDYFSNMGTLLSENLFSILNVSVEY